MGLEIAEHFEVAKAVFEETSNVLSYRVTGHSFWKNLPHESIKQNIRNRCY